MQRQEREACLNDKYTEWRRKRLTRRRRVFRSLYFVHLDVHKWKAGNRKQSRQAEGSEKREEVNAWWAGRKELQESNGIDVDCFRVKNKICAPRREEDKNDCRKLTPNRCKEQIITDGLAKSAYVMRKQNNIPPSKMKDNSRPDALTIGVSIYRISVWITKSVKTIPINDVTTGTIAYTESHFIYCSGRG